MKKIYIELANLLLKMFVFAAFWQYVKEHLSKHEIQRYTNLKNINTDAGRGRAWLRAAINEHSLEKYMHMLIENEVLIG